MKELTTWGLANTQGWMYRCTDRRYWTASWSGTFDTIDRDGPMVFTGHMWVSRNGLNIGLPYAVVDDYGDLVAVNPLFPATAI